jgi:DNA-directed RNA polymerase specialized sigma24 family protein
MKVRFSKNEIEEILLKFSYNKDSRNEAEIAFVLFYKEYSRYLTKVVSEALKKYPFFVRETINNVINDTFLKIFLNPFSFEIKDDDTDESTNLKLKGYLAIIAKNIIYDSVEIAIKENYLRKTDEDSLKENHLKLIDDDEQYFDPPDVIIPEELPLSQKRKILDEILNTFKERDRLILLTLYEYYYKDGDGKIKYTPTEVLDWLEITHKTSRANINQIKSRCDKKIIEHFEKSNLKIPTK